MAYADEVLADSPLALWMLDEATGPTIADSSGNGRNLTVNGAPTLGAATVMPSGSRSVDFSGSTLEYLSRAAEAWSAQPSFTITAWIRPDNVSSYRAIWSRDSVFTRAPTLYLTNGKLNLYRTDDIFGNATLSAGVAYFVGVTYDAATTTLRFYVDGALDRTVVTPLSNDGLSGNDIIIGASYAGSWSLNFPFDGRVGPVAYFGTALPGGRIDAHYAAGSGGASTIRGTLAATLPGPLS